MLCVSIVIKNYLLKKGYMKYEFYLQDDLSHYFNDSIFVIYNAL